jgi:hypothetical protein
LPYPREGTTSLLNSLKDAVLRGAEPETSARDNLQTLAIVQAGKLSAEEHRRVSIEEVLHQGFSSSERRISDFKGSQAREMCAVRQE